MTFKLLDNSQEPLDAHFDIEGFDIILHARGGGKRSVKSVNTDYATALRFILSRLRASGNSIKQVIVDSSVVAAMPTEERRILSQHEALEPPETVMRLITSRMKEVRPASAKPAKGGNTTKRIRISTEGQNSGEALAAALGGEKTDRNLRSLNRLPADELHRVRPHHVWNAVESISEGREDEAYRESTDYDLITADGHRLPPKMVFGMAASAALGFHVLPEHFTGGEGTTAFKALREAGFEVVPKGSPGESVPQDLAASAEDQEWAEGQPALVQHLKKERSRSLSRAKKTHFIDAHGRLFCERCGLVPSEMYGERVGDACIEVHHAAVAVSDMEHGHRTRLDDLEILCANCHRVRHAEMRLAAG